ncbi:hypothetical protein [Variovorax paradoxus]|uniref:Uncharacterized protein n=1 Tax=Variovorax paradoxus TaxID=34073 RepID=A0A6I6H8Z4_VARPD|nr:hypothetical protein [Variovorax paradoxus]QGW82119.1 hypothetical protein GOQ09_11210 [Variovorax paradoxus]
MFSIAPYYVEIVDDKKQPIDVWNIQKNVNLRGVVEQFLASVVDQPLVRETHQAKKTYVLRKLFTGSPRTVGGRYQTGHYGFESDIWDTVKKASAHKRTKVQADMLPFLFNFYFPKSTNAAQQKRGLLLLGRFNTMGIRSMIMPELKKYVAAAHPGLELRVDKVAPTAVVTTLLNQGQVKKIRLVKKSLPSDFASVLGNADKPEFLDLEYVFRLKRNSFFTDVDWIKKLVAGKIQTKDIFTISPDNQPDNIKVEIVHGSKTRVIDLGNRGKVSPNIDITDDVRVDATGHPDPESWLEQADDLASEILSSWGLSTTFSTKV